MKDINLTVIMSNNNNEWLPVHAPVTRRSSSLRFLHCVFKALWLLLLVILMHARAYSCRDAIRHAEEAWPLSCTSIP